MIPLITLAEPFVAPPPNPDQPDLEAAYRQARRDGWSQELAAVVAAGQLGLTVFDEAGDPIRWTLRTLRHLTFLRWLADRGGFANDGEPR